MEEKWPLAKMIREAYAAGPEMGERLEALLDRILRILKSGEES